MSEEDVEKKPSPKDERIDIRSVAKILVIDDSEYSRMGIVQILEKNGYNVVGNASGAKSTIEILRQQEANLFIIDVVMPEVNGLELAKEINEKYSNSNIILISSLAQEHIIVEGISLGALDFLHKPVEEKTLIDSVEKACSIMVEENRF